MRKSALAATSSPPMAAAQGAEQTSRTARAARRAALIAKRREERQRAAAAAPGRSARTRQLAFGAVVFAVLAVGAWLAFGDFAGQRGNAASGSIAVQASMAGFTPKEIRVRAGEAVALDFWTQDSPGHLERGVHTLISHELGLHSELPGAGPTGDSRVIVAFTAPETPGTYDIYCDTCCGGQENPGMHGTIVVEA